METIQQLLNRIRWDENFGRGDFTVGIYDRVKDAVEFQPLENLKQENGNHFSFTVCMEGEIVTIPFHRIRAVRKNGETIWQR
ncbi:DUF504 domain-containing protein [Pontiella sulfatireligans]|uniref:MJ1316 RNA cyclic group end recognition domain-containing protein n=1 Tax=Pontiella sulfatireligans TaxID=2750658 RepID=A0A6C2UTQ2_9BACT|nr:DUF504 domain-containing protein [Pontiella sulfatireligans]VGO22597.1 hypothetical protein SCARR_04682 [Pontiella sulfatireligans]